MTHARQDADYLHEAGVSLDRALCPLLVRLSAASSMSVATLAEQVGRDPSTVSRQLAKLEQFGLARKARGTRRLAGAAGRHHKGRIAPDERELFPMLLIVSPMR